MSSFEKDLQHIEAGFQRGISRCVGEIFPDSLGPILVGVSGGVDSVALLRVLLRFQKLLRGRRLIVLHYNHGLRGDESDRDELFVRELSARLGVECIVGKSGENGTPTVLEGAKVSGNSIEMEARRCRYSFFAKCAFNLKASMLMLAHHANDQAELFFIRLFRGASATGLLGMQSVSPFPFPLPQNYHLLVGRPFLLCERAQLETYLRHKNEKWVEDSTNQSSDYLRNKIRLKLLPSLLKEFPKTNVQTIARSMTLLSEELSAIDMLLEQTKLVFDCLPMPLKRRLINKELQKLGTEPSFQAIEFLLQHPGKELHIRMLGGDTFIHLYRVDGAATLRLVSEPEMRVPIGEIILNLEGKSGEFPLPGKSPLDVIWQVQSVENPVYANGKDAFSFDADFLGGQVRFRHPRPGDRYRPIGLNGSKKLQDVFVNKKIPADIRSQLWLAETLDGCIFWVQELRIGEEAKVTDRTKRVLLMKLQLHLP